MQTLLFKKCKFYLKDNLEIINLTKSNNEESLTQFSKLQKVVQPTLANILGWKLLVSKWEFKSETCLLSQRSYFPECIVKFSSLEAS